MGHPRMNRICFTILLLTHLTSRGQALTLCGSWATDLSFRAMHEWRFTSLGLVMPPLQDNTDSVVITSPESPPSNISCTCLLLCLFYYRERLCEYCTEVNKKIHMLSLKNAQMQGPLGLDQDCVAAANSLCGPR